MKVKFGDILYIKGRIGWQRLSKDEYLSTGEYYLVTGVDITDEHRIDFSKCYYVTKERYELDDKIQLKEGDVIVTKDGTIGKIGIIENLDKPATLNSHLFLIRNERPDILDTSFLFYILRSNAFQKFAANNTSGSNIPAFTQENISKFEYDLPSIEDQRKIATVLKEIDAKIRNNNSICSNLEAMAKTLYDYWFVQFDFPDENGKPYKTSGGKIVWNEDLKREVPEGWSVSAIKDICSFENGDRSNNYPSGDDFKKEGIPFIAGGDIEDRTVNYQSVRFITKEKFNSLRAGKAKHNDILMTLRGSLARCVYSPFDDAAIASALVIIRPKETINNVFLYHLLTSDYFERICNNYNNGSVQANLSVDVVGSFKFVIPPRKMLEKYTSVIEKTDKEIIEKISENKKITELRDFLFPMLMNGQVKIKEAE